MRRLATLAAAAAFLPAAASAAVITVDADAYVRGGRFADTNYGTDDVLRAERDPSAGRRYRATVLRFDVGSLSGQDVAAATFGITQASTGSQQVELFALADGQDGWSETDLTYDRALATGLASGGFTSLGLIDLAAGGAGSLLTLSGQGLVDALAAAGSDGLISFVLVSTQPDNSSSARFASRENGGLAGAFLDVTTAAVPVPPATALFPLGLLALARRRARA